jgi:hypothetical protein
MPQKHFTPGKKSGTARMINYIAAYNAAFPNSEQLTCTGCVPDKYDKLTLGSDSPSTRVSNNIRVSQIVNFEKGGTTHFGNFYLGQIPNVNYLGRTAGMPGGSGSAPKNTFN